MMRDLVCNDETQNFDKRVSCQKAGSITDFMSANIRDTEEVLALAQTKTE